MSIVICIAGPISSGKTYLANLVSSKYGFARASFGDYLRDLAGVDKNNRRYLQDLGQKLFDEDKIGFTRKVINFSGWNGSSNLLVDGVRHVEVFDLIVNLALPIPTFLVFLEADPAIRISRLGNEVIEEVDRHITENDVLNGKLKERANYTLDTSLGPQEIEDKVAKWFKSCLGS